MGKIKNNLIRLLGGVPFEDYSKGLEEYRQYCDKVLKEHHKIDYLKITGPSVSLVSSRFIEKEYYTNEIYQSIKREMINEFMDKLDQNKLIVFSSTTNSDDIIRIDARMRVIEP